MKNSEMMHRTVLSHDGKSNKMKDAGRFGDKELAHVTVNEKILPLSVQTPEVNAVVSNEFNRQGIPEDRYTVQNTAGGSKENSQNPETGNKEYFLKKLAKVALGAGTGFLTGGKAGALLGAGSAIVGGGGGGGGGGGFAPAEAAPPALPAPVAAITQANEMARVSRLPSMGMGGGGNSIIDPASNSNASMQPSMGGGQSLTPTSEGGGGMVSGWRDAPDNIAALLQELLEQKRNEQTGFQQFYDTSRIRKNPTTGKMEFFDEQFYRRTNADVDAAVRRGEYSSGLDHFNRFGRAENRTHQPPAPVNVAPSAPPRPTATAAPAVSPSFSQPRPQQTNPQPYSGHSHTDMTNFNDRAVQQFGQGLVRATPIERSILEDIFGSTTNNTAGGGGARSRVFSANPNSNEDAFSRARSRGLSGFGSNTPEPSYSLPTRLAERRTEQPAMASSLEAPPQPQQPMANTARVSQMSPVRDNRFRSRGFQGRNIARNF